MAFRTVLFNNSFVMPRSAGQATQPNPELWFLQFMLHSKNASGRRIHDKNNPCHTGCQ